MKKKILALMAVAVLAIGMSFVMTSCGSDDENTIVLWTHNDEDTWNESYQGIVDAYMEEHPDVKIKVESFPYDEYESKVQTALMSDEGGADIYELWGGWCVDYAPSGALEALPEDMQTSIKSECYPNTYGALESEGVLYGVPLEYNIECGGLIVNNNIMKEAGVSVPTTWSEVKAAAVKGTTITDGEVEIKGFDFVNWDGVMYLWTSMILSQGGSYLNSDGTFNVTSAQAKLAWDELASMVTTDKVTTLSGLDDGSDVEGYQELYAGTVMMVPRGPWTLREGENDFELTYGKDYSYVAMPFYGSQKKFATETGWSMGVASGLSDEKKAIAFDFIQYMTSDEVALENNLACGTIPAKKSVAQSAEYLEKNDRVAPLIPILSGGQYIGDFNTDMFKEAVNDAFSAYCKGKYASADECLAALQTKLNKKVAQ